MKNRKITMFIIIIFLIIFILAIGFLVINNKKQNKNNLMGDYTPEQEITDEQLRQTNILLYFYDNTNECLATEVRKIDAKELLNNPEEILIKYLIEGPQNDNLLKLIPEETTIVNTKFYNGILEINFSEEFSKNKNEQFNNDIIKESIFKTVSQLNEINQIKILINKKEI